MHNRTLSENRLEVLKLTFTHSSHSFQARSSRRNDCIKYI